MIDWLLSLDYGIFRFINLSLSNRLFDHVMPFVSDMPGFVPIAMLILALLIWKGGARGRICAGMLVLGLLIGDVVVADSIKHGVARLRPFNHFPDAHVFGGRTATYSMPSSHALNCFCAAMVTFFFYRRVGMLLFPLAALVGFSRIYNGMHYPSDVLTGATLGAGCGAAIVWSTNALWQWAGRRWFPVWHAQLPSLMNPVVISPPPENSIEKLEMDKHWMRLGFVVIGALFVARLGYLASGTIELSEDEAYQWIWSKHLALSYYSKPLLIALVQFLGTHIWGDNYFGVRFFSPVIAAVLSVLTLRFLSREGHGKAGFATIIILSVTPLTALGAILMTVDPLSVLFWTAAMIAGWRAAKPDGTTRQWIWAGLWTGLGFLSKPTNLFQLVCWGVFFSLWPAARSHLRRRGPWLALLVAMVCSLPFWIWNMENHWITFQHIASDGQLGQPWKRTFTLDFVLGEAGVLNPFFFIGAIWAAIAFWRKGRNDPLQLLLFSMGAPLVLVYLLLSLHSRVELNWIAPSVVPLFCLMAVYRGLRWATTSRFLKSFFCLGIGIGLFAVVTMHNSNLLTKILRHSLPADFDPLRRVLGWKQLAQIAGQERLALEMSGEKPAFIIGEHYGMTSEATFYLPLARATVKDDPFIYCYATREPRNQFYFWPNYLSRTGQNAIFMVEVERPKLRPDWFSRWWRREGDLYLTDPPPKASVPAEVREQFESITDLGVRDVVVPGKGILRRVEFFACHNLRPHEPAPR